MPVSLKNFKRFCTPFQDHRSNKIVIHDWQYHKPTKKTVGGRNFTQMNKRALQNGLHTSSVNFKEIMTDF